MPDIVLLLCLAILFSFSFVDSFILTPNKTLFVSCLGMLSFILLEIPETSSAPIYSVPVFLMAKEPAEPVYSHGFGLVIGLLIDGIVILLTLPRNLRPFLLCCIADRTSTNFPFPLCSLLISSMESLYHYANKLLTILWITCNLGDK